MHVLEGRGAVLPRLVGVRVRVRFRVRVRARIRVFRLRARAIGLGLGLRLGLGLASPSPNQGGDRLGPGRVLLGEGGKVVHLQGRGKGVRR